MAVKFHQLPSQIIRITDPIDAFRFDRAVHYFGVSLENALEQVTGKNDKEINAKRLRIFNKWIPGVGNSEMKFRDPAKG
jgi:hypothetical protein